MSTIYILWLRQLKRYLRSRPRLIGLVGQSLIFLFAFGFGFAPIYQKAGEGNYMQFLAPGIIAMGILFTAIFSGVEIIWDRQFGFLKETLVAPVSRFNIVIGRTLGNATAAMFQGVVAFVIALFIGFHPQVSMFPLAFVFMALIALIFAAIGTAIGSFLEDMQGYQLILNFIVMPVFFLSGAIFPLKDLPGAILFFSRVNPLTYGVDGLRGALAGGTHFAFFADFAILSGAAILFLVLGSYLFSRIQI